MINKDIALYKAAVKFNSDLIVFPIVAAFLIFIVNATDKVFDINGILDINVWIGSFATSFFVYMVFDLILSKASFLKHHKYLFIGLSFVISTFLGSCIQYSLKNDLNVEYIKRLVLVGFIDAVFLIAMVIYGLKSGIEKTRIKSLEEKAEYDAFIKSISKKDKASILKICKKAMKIDEETFMLITFMKSKENIKIIMGDLEQPKPVSD